MQLELGKFLKSIDVNDEVYNYFNSATLVEAIPNKKRQGFILRVVTPHLIDINIYEQLQKSLNVNRYHSEIYFEITNKNEISDLAVNTYFLYFVKATFYGTPLYEALSKLKLILVNGTIVLSLNSQMLQTSVEKYRGILEQDFKKAGFTQPLAINLEPLQDNEITKLMEQAKADQLNNLQTYIEPPKPEENPTFKRHITHHIDISDQMKLDSYVQFKGRIFQIDRKDMVGKEPIFTIYVTNDKDSIILKPRPKKFPVEFLASLKEEDYVDVVGKVEEDYFTKDIVVAPRRLQKLDLPPERYDDEEQKRVELHLHTNYSTLDGVCTFAKYAELAAQFGHKALAITDHATVQGFPEAQAAGKKYNLKILYGMEGYVVKEAYHPALVSRDIPLDHATFVCFDLETTGLNPRYDEIIEIGAVKYKDGQIVDSFQTFVNPKRRISAFTTQLCGITDDDVIGAPLLEEVASSFRKFVGDGILVAHNASFDYTFINEAFRKRTIPIFSNACLDTLDLAHCVLLKRKSYSLGAVSRALNIEYDEVSAHRADYDAKVLGEVLLSLLNLVENEHHLNNLNQLNSLSPEDACREKHPFHVTFLVKNKVGLKNLYRLLSLANTVYFRKVPLIPEHLINENREGLLVGSACFNSEVFDLARTGTEAQLRKCIQGFDYIEIQPLANYSYLLDTGAVESEAMLIKIIKDIIRISEEEHKIVVATGDCHYLNPRDQIVRDAFIVWHPKNQQANHPLYDSKGRVKHTPQQHFRSTREMLEGFSYLSEEKAREYVITNPNKIVDLVENIAPIEHGSHALKAPVLKGIDVQQELENICFANAHRIYGNPLPNVVEERLRSELHSLKENNYAIIYYFAYKLVNRAVNDGDFVGSRGSVGSSFVATMSGITEVNPLAPHYICPNCHYFEEVNDGSVSSGYDLPLKMCPKCGHVLDSNGQNIPFATFLGFHGDKVPDIDLNFSGDYQATAHEYTKELLDENHVFRAGTIATVKERTAYGVARNYFEYMNKFDLRKAEYARLAHYCSGTKRTTGQHPGGIVVVPLDMDILDFTPVQYPADDLTAHWKTTHLDYESMHDELLKLDILGHDDPTAIKMLKRLTGVDPNTIPLSDPKVLSLFTSTDALGVTPQQIHSDTGVSGVPEFGTENTKRILADCRPTKFSELVQISGISHGTDVWSGNAQDLIRSGQATLMQCIGCRDDVMTFLMSKGLEPLNAFKIMECVRKKDKNVSKEQEQDMRSHGVPEYYIESAKKIKYMFPKAHAVAYVSMALRIAWFKVYRPIEYYATFFTVRCPEYDIETMIKGGDELVNKLNEALNTANDRSRKQAERKKAADLYDTLLLSLEFNARGFKFANVSLTKSLAGEFAISEDRTQLIPPFDTIPGLGFAVASTIVEARQEHPFTSQEDLSKRTKINRTQLKYLEKMGSLKNIGVESQLSLNLFGD
ncbi:MAG: PolC-type DNA polymerase III [Bacilli bacterium]|nr:PolC-type DNA polymerase III [Bacilli bacterium]MDD3422613.1 PolC-type DNA polymerase III [Bacilli bacterium]MDD4065907.1 PolC-type DNA polymerase III [Bacilli bacterium]